MAEMFGKIDGCSRGRGGSMHLFSREHRFFGGNAIVGGGIPQAVGLAFAAKMQKEDRMTFCFFGEGAMAEGAFHESINLAALWRTPVLFCCENNLYAMGTALTRSESQTSMVAKARSYNVEAEAVDGMNVVDVYEKARVGLEYIRREQRPFFLEFKTFRFRPHSMFDPELYRQKAEVDLWKAKCPIESLKTQLMQMGILSLEKSEIFSKEVEFEMQQAIEFAEASPLEPVSEIGAHLYYGGQL